MLVVLFLFISVAKSSLGSSTEDHSISREWSSNIIPAVSDLIISLDDEWWGDEEPCRRATLDLLKEVQNNTLWAMWAWDSIQPPAGVFYGARYHIGYYEQCLQVPWATTHPGLHMQYCLVDFTAATKLAVPNLDPFSKADNYLQSRTAEGRVFGTVAWGTCVPAACGPRGVARLASLLVPAGRPTVDPRNCQRLDQARTYTNGFLAFCTLVAMLFATAVFSTTYSGYKHHNTFLDTLTDSFCMKRNYNGLFKENRNEIRVLNGLRCIPAIIIVIYHESMYTALSPFINGLDLEKILIKSNLGQIMTRLEVVVDTFFAISGLLLIRGLMMEPRKNLFYAVVKRYMRLIGPLALATLFLTTTIVHLDRGPIWVKAHSYEVDVCVDSWWKNFLMINNFDTHTLCHIVTWYVSCDFQLCVVATFAYWASRRNARIATVVSGFLTALVTIYLGFTVYSRKLGVVPITDLKFFFNLRNYTDLNYTYISTTSRFGAYFVGMSMGYILATYNPCLYRNVINKKWSHILAVASFSTLMMVLSIGAICSGRPYNPIEAAVVTATNRIFWAVGICGIIAVCEYGSLPLITDLLSWAGFIPLGKLSYGLYLLHPFVIQKKKFSTRSVDTFSLFSTIANSPGIILLGYAASLIVYLILEAPLINLSNILLSGRRKELTVTEASENGTSCRNSQDSKSKIY